MMSIIIKKRETLKDLIHNQVLLELKKKNRGVKNNLLESFKGTDQLLYTRQSLLDHLTC